MLGILSELAFTPAQGNSTVVGKAGSSYPANGAGKVPTYKADGPTIETPENSGPGSPPISERFAHLLPTARDGNGRSGSDAGGTSDSVLSIEIGRKSLKGTGVAGSGRGESGKAGRVADGIRTRDIQIHNRTEPARRTNPKPLCHFYFSFEGTICKGTHTVA